MLYWPYDAAVQVRAPWWRRGGPRSVGFRSARGGGRLHAACDLVAPRGTPIRAIANGTVLDYSSFYKGTWELVVRHEHEDMVPFIVRYGEVLAPADGGIQLTRGTEVSAGQVIAKVGQLSSRASMLHFELYATTRWPHPSLSVGTRWDIAPESYTEADKAAVQAHGWHWDFQRRLDMADPTDFLLALRDGQAPPQPVPYSAPDQSSIPVLEEILITPSETFIREQAHLRAQQSRLRTAQEYENWLDQQGRIDSRRGFRMPGPLGFPTADLRRLPCEYFTGQDENRHGPD